MHETSTRIAAMCSLLAAAATVAACTHGVSRVSQGSLPGGPTSSLALRIVDSSRAAEPLLAVRLRLIGPVPRQDTVVCSDSTRQPVLWVASLQPGRYQLVLNRVGFERRVVVVDVAEHRTDTITVGLRPPARALEERVSTFAPLPRCGKSS